MPGAEGDSSRICGREGETAKADKNCDNNDYGSDKAENAEIKCWSRSHGPALLLSFDRATSSAAGNVSTSQTELECSALSESTTVTKHAKRNYASHVRHPQHKKWHTCV